MNILWMMTINLYVENITKMIVTEHILILNKYRKNFESSCEFPIFA